MMVPLGAFAVTLASVVRTSSIVSPSPDSLPGSTCTRTAGVCWPPTSTCATPFTWLSCCASTFSA